MRSRKVLTGIYSVCVTGVAAAVVSMVIYLNQQSMTGFALFKQLLGGQRIINCLSGRSAQLNSNNDIANTFRIYNSHILSTKSFLSPTLCFLAKVVRDFNQTCPIGILSKVSSSTVLATLQRQPPTSIPTQETTMRMTTPLMPTTYQPSTSKTIEICCPKLEFFGGTSFRNQGMRSNIFEVHLLFDVLQPFRPFL